MLTYTLVQTIRHTTSIMKYFYSDNPIPSINMFIKKTKCYGSFNEENLFVSMVLQSFRTFKLNDQKQCETCPVTKNQTR